MSLRFEAIAKCCRTKRSKMFNSFLYRKPPSCAVIILVGNMSNGCRQIYSIRTADSFGLLILSSSRLSLSLYTVLAKCYFAAAVLYALRKDNGWWQSRPQREQECVARNNNIPIQLKKK